LYLLTLSWQKRVTFARQEVICLDSPASPASAPLSPTTTIYKRTRGRVISQILSLIDIVLILSLQALTAIAGPSTADGPSTAAGPSAAADFSTVPDLSTATSFIEGNSNRNDLVVAYSTPNKPSRRMPDRPLMMSLRTRKPPGGGRGGGGGSGAGGD